jgi:hypothetical protein
MMNQQIRCSKKYFSFCFMLMIITASSLFSYSGPDEPLTVIIETEPDIPFVGLEWKISLLVDHPEVGQVFIQTPPFSEDAVRLDRVRTEPYFMYSGNNLGESWTLVEFFFIPLKPGTIILPPFEIRTPEKNAFTSQMVFHIEAHEGTYIYQPELRWESVPDSLPQGKADELLLVMQNNDPQKKPDDSLLITIDIPEHAIMERISLSDDDRRKNGILRLRIIPLENETMFINPIIVEYEEFSLASPPLQIHVVPSSAANNQSVSAYSLSAEELNYHLDDENPASHEQDESSSSLRRYFPSSLKKQYDEIIQKTEELWNNDEQAEALAFIRKAERESIIGFSLRSVRKNLEQELELGITDDEAYLPVKPLLILCAVFFILSIILFFKLIFSRKKKTSFSFFRIICYAVLVLCIIAALISAILGIIGIIKDSGKDAPHQVVLYQTDVYRVPEISGAVSGSFKEGEPGIIRSSAGDWLYIETRNGQAGWVQTNRVIRY